MKYNWICMEKKNSGEKTNEMPESKVWSNENSACFVVENEIPEDLGDKKMFKTSSVYTWEGGNNIGSRYDESEEQRLEKSDEECLKTASRKNYLMQVL